MLLAIDTATATASAAVYDTERQQLLAETTWQARRRHTQDLIVTVDRLLVQAGADVGDLSALAVTTGPGSFTGVRIGISAVKGLGLGLAHPPCVIGLPTLCVTAAPWIGLADAVSPPATVCAFIQAGRGRYNWTWFDAGDLRARPGSDEHCAGTASEFADALAARSPRPVWLAGEWNAALSDATSCELSGRLAHVHALDGVSALRRAGHLAHVAALHLAAGEYDDLAALQPIYLRNP